MVIDCRELPLWKAVLGSTICLGSAYAQQAQAADYSSRRDAALEPTEGGHKMPREQGEMGRVDVGVGVG